MSFYSKTFLHLSIRNADTCLEWRWFGYSLYRCRNDLRKGQDIHLCNFRKSAASLSRYGTAKRRATDIAAFMWYEYEFWNRSGFLSCIVLLNDGAMESDHDRFCNAKRIALVLKFVLHYHWINRETFEKSNLHPRVLFVDIWYLPISVFTKIKVKILSILDCWDMLWASFHFIFCSPAKVKVRFHIWIFTWASFSSGPQLLDSDHKVESLSCAYHWLPSNVKQHCCISSVNKRYFLDTDDSQNLLAWSSLAIYKTTCSLQGSCYRKI